ncbi:unnamed protein product, partial [Owenia fusiformis]
MASEQARLKQDLKDALERGDESELRRRLQYLLPGLEFPKDTIVWAFGNNVTMSRETIQLLMEYGMDINARYKCFPVYGFYENDKTALMFAAEKNNLECCRTLIDHGADVNASAINGQTALMFAAEKNNVECCRTLIDHGA